MHKINTNYLKILLEDGLQQLELSYTDILLSNILLYVNLIIKWNKISNLTSILLPEQIIIRHIFDSLSIIRFIIGYDILDFGTGAGLPGIPLSLFLPNYRFTLIDSSSKKTSFLDHVIFTLKIKNVSVLNERIEKFSHLKPFNVIVTRATYSINTAIDKIKHLSSSKQNHGSNITYFLAMKGKKSHLYNELLSVDKNIYELHTIKVPYLNEERTLVKLLI